MVVCCFLLALPTYAQTTFNVTFKPGPGPGEDALLYHTLPSGCIPTGWSTVPDVTNLGNHSELIYHANTISALGCNSAYLRSVIRFTDITNGSIPAGATITNAILTFHGVPTSGSAPGNQGQNDGLLQLLGAGDNWTENTITWDNMVNNMALTGPTMAIPPSASQWNWDVSLNVTNWVQDIFNGIVPNNGFMLRLLNEQVSRYVIFASSDHSDPNLWPELQVTYTLPTCDPDFSWTMSTTSPNTYKFTAQNPSLTGYTYQWTINSTVVGIGPALTYTFPNSAATTYDVTLHLLVNGNEACSERIHFCHCDKGGSTTGGCNTHFNVTSNTNAPNTIWLRPLNPGYGYPYRWEIYNSPTNLYMVVYSNNPAANTPPPINLPPGNFYTIKMITPSGCSRTSLVHCFNANVPSPYKTNDPSLDVQEAVTNKEQPANLQIIPNPANDIVTIKMNDVTGPTVKVMITDVTGKAVYTSREQVDKNNSTIKISVSTLPAAFYNVQVDDGSRIRYGKMVKQ